MARTPDRGKQQAREGVRSPALPSNFFALYVLFTRSSCHLNVKDYPHLGSFLKTDSSLWSYAPTWLHLHSPVLKAFADVGTQAEGRGRGPV